jgi:hypothetical protein
MVCTPFAPVSRRRRQKPKQLGTAMKGQPLQILGGDQYAFHVIGPVPVASVDPYDVALGKHRIEPCMRLGGH